MAIPAEMGCTTVLHPIITVTDMDEALGFYRDLLGFRVDRQFTQDPTEIGPLLGLTDPDIRAVILKAEDGSEIELMEFRRPVGKREVETRAEDAGFMAVTILVNDLSSVIARINESRYSAEGEVVSFAGPGGIRAVICEGPDRTRVLLGERTT